jgi:hypothetical protein
MSARIRARAQASLEFAEDLLYAAQALTDVINLSFTGGVSSH